MSLERIFKSHLKLEIHTNQAYSADMPQFTADNAAEMGKRGAEARWSKPANETPIAEQTTIDYTTIRLMRVRKQLDRLDELASEETDPKRCKEFADATSRLQEQERQLAGRPLPGTLKPTQTKQRRPEPMPEPTIPQVVVQPDITKPQ